MVHSITCVCVCMLRLLVAHISEVRVHFARPAAKGGTVFDNSDKRSVVPSTV